MTKERNALAELAHDLNVVKMCACVLESDCEVVEKARCIIAELAKLKVSNELIGVLPRLHTIAEKGEME